MPLGWTSEQQAGVETMVAVRYLLLRPGGSPFRVSDSQRQLWRVGTPGLHGSPVGSGRVFPEDDET